MSFKYRGYTFTPAGKNPFEWNDTAKRIRSCGIGLTKQNGKYTYKGFYRASGNSDSDLFLCHENNKFYIPGSNELFEFPSWTGTKMKLKEEVKYAN